MHFFFYGTLLDRRVRRAVIGPAADRLAALPAILHGWRRVRVQGRQYPVIVRKPGATVDGCVFGPLPASAVAKLIRFEGPEYRLIPVEVVSAAAARMSAHTFIGSGSMRATTAEWRFDDWKRRHRAAFLRGIDRRGRRAV